MGRRYETVEDAKSLIGRVCLAPGRVVGIVTRVETLREYGARVHNHPSEHYTPDEADQPVATVEGMDSFGTKWVKHLFTDRSNTWEPYEE